LLLRLVSGVACLMHNQWFAGERIELVLDDTRRLLFARVVTDVVEIKFSCDEPAIWDVRSDCCSLDSAMRNHCS
jgi:hypothetical protein